MCTHHISGDSRGLVCENEQPHDAPHGCVYKASSVGDRHDAADSAARQDNEGKR